MAYLEDFVGFFVPSHGADGHDERMSRIVHAGLNDVVQREPRGCRHVPQFGVDLARQTFRHPIVMLKQ